MTSSRQLKICALAVAALALSACKSKGVDMRKGGTELAYELKGKSGEAALAEARKLALARLSAIKVPAKALIDGERLRVQIPKSVDEKSLEMAKTVLGLVGRFEVREVDDGASLRALGPDIPEDAGARLVQDTWTDHTGANRGAFTVVSASAQVARKVLETAGFKAADGLELMPERPLDPTQVRVYTVRAPALSNDSVKTVGTPYDAYLPPEVSVTFNEAGTKAYEELTSKNLGRKIAFVVDGEILETAAVLAPVSVGKASISQPWTGTKEQQQRQAEVYAAALRFGPMPGTLELAEEREVGASR